MLLNEKKNKYNNNTMHFVYATHTVGAAVDGEEAAGPDVLPRCEVDSSAFVISFHG